MQINNTPTPSFKGLYIVKGTANKVEQATQQIKRACSNPTVHEALAEEAAMFGKVYQAPARVVTSFFDCIHYGLVDIFDSLQPFVQNIIATNEDTEIITNHMNRFFKGLNSDADSEENAKEIFSKIASVVIEHEQKKEAYQDAKNQCDKGNGKPLLDIIAETQNEARKVLKEILDPYGINPNSVKVLSAENVLKGIENDTFNYSTGDIREKVVQYSN